MKSLSEFPLRKDSSDGRRNQCNTCRNKYVEDWKSRRDEIKAEKERLHSAPVGFKYCRGEFGCGELKPINEFRLVKSEPRGYCTPCDKRNKARDWTMDKEEFDRQYALELEAKAEEKRVRDEERPAKTKEHHHQYYLDNKEAFYERKAKRRARKLGVFEHFTERQRAITRECFGNRCYMCGATDSLCIDHHRPLSAGNALVLSNAVLLCKGCNSEKHNKEPEAFYGAERCLKLDIRLLLIEYLYG